MKKRLIFMIMAALFLAPVLQGCAASSRTSRSETTIYHMVEAPEIEGNKGNFPGGEISASEKNTQAKVVKKKTQIKEERQTSEPRGIFGTTFHFIGQVLAFPFKVIAGIIEFIF